jgi:DNA-binding PadR family transcriptional regulator
MKRKTSAAMALTELEGCVLGVIATRGPCTPYAIRREFRASPSRHWSASAGAIYPLIIRLQRGGLVQIERKTGDGRGARLYSLTSAGQRALRHWLGPPCSALATSVPPDPLRNRIAFLATLDTRAQAAFFADVLERVRDDLQKIRAYSEHKKEQGDTFEYLISCGSLSMMQARLRWLQETAHRLGL